MTACARKRASSVASVAPWTGDPRMRPTWRTRSSTAWSRVAPVQRPSRCWAAMVCCSRTCRRTSSSPTRWVAQEALRGRGTAPSCGRSRTRPRSGARRRRRASRSGRRDRRARVPPRSWLRTLRRSASANPTPPSRPPRARRPSAYSTSRSPRATTAAFGTVAAWRSWATRATPRCPTQPKARTWPWRTHSSWHRSSTPPPRPARATSRWPWRGTWTDATRARSWSCSARAPTGRSCAPGHTSSPPRATQCWASSPAQAWWGEPSRMSSTVALWRCAEAAT
mmetsp:Transcript_27578/g.74235  ORF Transcript_27578/g.74235 Transcript_27578/m.74235 type:complete len:281 (+) Transcript_27578:485-1327(+)